MRPTETGQEKRLREQGPRNNSGALSLGRERKKRGWGAGGAGGEDPALELLKAKHAQLFCLAICFFASEPEC